MTLSLRRWAEEKESRTLETPSRPRSCMRDMGRSGSEQLEGPLAFLLACSRDVGLLAMFAQDDDEALAMVAHGCVAWKWRTSRHQGCWEKG